MPLLAPCARAFGKPALDEGRVRVEDASAARRDRHLRGEILPLEVLVDRVARYLQGSRYLCDPLADELLGIPPRSRLSAGSFLWIVERASEESFRKTARAFFGLTGARISHVTVMRCVHAEGELLKRAPEKVRHLSCEGVRIEVDGLWIPLQAEEHREEALPRFLYEQARKRASLELKVASVYAGKVREGPGRKRRLALHAIALDADADSFFDRVWEHVASEYDEETLRRIHYGADGGSWCGPERMEERAPENAEVLFSLDRFHLIRAICRAYPKGPVRDWAQSLALRGKGPSLARIMVARMPSGPRKEKVRSLVSCAASNARAIRTHGASLGVFCQRLISEFVTASFRLSSSNFFGSRHGRAR